MCRHITPHQPHRFLRPCHYCCLLLADNAILQVTHIIVDTPDAEAVPGSFFGAGVGAIFLGSVSCSGSEASIFDCTATSFPACDHTANDAGVRCSSQGRHPSTLLAPL